MSRAATVAWWTVPSLVCLALYWYALKTWFQADDFAWLGIGLDVHNWRDLLSALFSPKAQGTIRPWSERAFFMAFFAVFGLDALPFHIAAFAVQVANLLLLASITRRVTGSRAAGFWAPVLWAVNSALAEPLGWASVFNEPLCALFLLLAFHFLLRYMETGERRYYVWQWIAFVLGFGALELNLVYPALAAAYAYLCARKFFRGTLPLFAVSAVYVIVHKVAVPLPASGEYAMHFTGSIARTLFTYWTWSIGPTFLTTPLVLPRWVLPAGIALVSLALLAFAVRRRAAWFCLAWYVIALGPVLPLRDHLTEYYIYVPLIGLAMLGGWAIAEAWRGSMATRAAAVVLAIIYAGMTAPEARAASTWLYHRTKAVQQLVQGVEAARELHPGKTILLEDVSNELFWTGVFDRPFRLFGADNVYCAPGTETRVQAHPEWGRLDDYILAAPLVERALDDDSIVVYSAAGGRLRNITSLYATRAHEGALRQFTAAGLRRVDVASAASSALLGPEWYPPDGSHRWMPKRASVTLAGPQTAVQKLYLAGNYPEEWLRTGPLGVRVTVDGAPLPPAEIRESAFELAFPLPAATVGKPEVKVMVEVSRTEKPPGDGRELGLAFGTLEIR